MKNIKILVVKLGSIGDVVHTLPILKIIKDNYPESKVSWLVESKSANILKDNPYINHIYIFNRKIKDFFKLSKKIRQEKFDWVIDFQGTYKSQAFVLFSKGKNKAGYNKTREKIPFSYNKNIKLKTMDRHAVDRNIDLLNFCIPFVKQKIEFPINIVKEEKNNVEKIINKKDIKNPYGVISVSCGKPANRWPLEYFVKLMDLFSDSGISLVLIGSAREKEINDSLIKQTKNNKVYNTAGEHTLKETACLIKDSKFLVCGDTGPMHIAVAVNTPVITLFGGANPVRTGPYQGLNIIVKKDMECAPCYKKYCENNICMQSIEPYQVYVQCTKKLKNN